jgi:1,4-dihydroxy-2-naphthoyl-CoA synthase
MAEKPALRIETRNGVRSIIFSRPEQYNTITPQLRDELTEALDAAGADHEFAWCFCAPRAAPSAPDTGSIGPRVRNLASGSASAYGTRSLTSG